MGASYKFDRGMAARFRKGAEQGVAAAAIHLQGAIKKTLNSGGASNIMSGGRGSQPGQPPNKDTGTLGRSIQVDRSQVRSVNPTARVGSALPYARILELGGTIHPRNVKMLPVPFPGAAAKRVRRDAGETLRNDKDLFLFRSKRGNLILAKMIGSGKREKMTPLFILKKEVRIRARPYLRPTLAREKTAIIDTMRRFYADAIRGGKPGGSTP